MGRVQRKAGVQSAAKSKESTPSKRGGGRVGVKSTGDATGKRATLKLTTVGSSTGVVLPINMLERLRVQKGDLLHVTEVPDGYMIRALDDTFASQMEVVETIMHRRRDMLRKLAE